MTGLPVERYLRLGLQLGRHVDGIVDAYYRPPELAAAVEAEPPVDPRTLVAEAEALLDEVDDGWLRDQDRPDRAPDRGGHRGGARLDRSAGRAAAGSGRHLGDRA